MATLEHAVGQISHAEEAAITQRRPLGMARTIRRVAVLGAGTMGARVAAHFANAGASALLLSRASTKDPNRSATAAKAIQAVIKQKPASFFAEEQYSLVKTGNYEDNLKDIADCDLIIETTTENLQIKRDLWAEVQKVCRPDAIRATCTSGIPITQIAAGFPDEFRRNFLGVHFFNPPRYLHLLEVIPGPETDPAVVSFVEEYASRRLGKGVVLCKDTPNFVANRTGIFFGATVTKVMMDLGYTIEEADELTGPLIGLPSSASFRLVDLVGLDIYSKVGTNLHADVPDDPWRDRFLLPEFENEMIARNWLGDKTGQGFYKKVGSGEKREIWALDWKTLEYHPIQKPKFASVDAAKAVEDVPERVKMLINSDDRAGQFLWRVFSDYFLYAAEKIPEISDRIVEIDRGMRWGYAHKLGPFEMWDALGFQEIGCRLKKEGRALPHHIEEALAAGVTSLYRPVEKSTTTQYFDFIKHGYETLEARSGVVSLADVKRANGVVKKNAGASLVDLGDGVLCCEFHSKMNSIGEDTIAMLFAGVEELNKNFDAMIVANEGETFCVGGNLVGILMSAQDGEWDELDAMLNRIQQANMAMKYAAKPVVSAPFSRTLGGGCEIVLHTMPVASAELYMGQVELGVGLIPAAGGCKELVLRHKEARKPFELIGFVKVSMSAEEAKNLGLLDRAAPICMNPERLIADAKAYALSLAPRWVVTTPRTDVKVQGDSAYALMKLGAWTALQGGYISEHDMLIAEKLAFVLAGGRLMGDQLVSEQYLLDLEREAFLSLAGTKKTQDRIAHMLKTGKPLRN